MSTACGRPQGVEGDPAHVDACGQRGRGVKNLIFCGRHISPIPVQFPPNSSSSPYLQMFLCSYTKFSSPYQNVTFPSPKLTKSFVFPLNENFPHKMGLMKISASFPPWDGPPGLYKPRVIYG